MNIINELVLAFGEPAVVASSAVTLLAMFFAQEIKKVREFLFIIVKSSPKFALKIIRNNRAISKRKLKKIRQNGDAVTFQSLKAHAYFILFIGSIFFYIALAALGPLKFILELTQTNQLLVALPIYVFEVLWLSNSIRAHELIGSRGKLGVTSSGRNIRHCT